MDNRLIDYYNRELQHLRETGGEFAREFPKIAGRLSLDERSCADPYVERILEGFAFLSARVHLKLDAEFPRFTQALLESIYPAYLAPTPSMTVVQFKPDPNESAPGKGHPLPRGTPIRNILGKGELTTCEYRTSQDVQLLPIQVSEARYYTRELAALDIPQSLGAKAGIRIRLSVTGATPFEKLEFDQLRFFIRALPDPQMRIYEQIFGHCRGVAVQRPLKPAATRTLLPAGAIRQVGFADSEALLPVTARGFSGYRLLQEYFAFPQRFMFFEVTGLSKAIVQCGGREIDLVLLLDAIDLRLENNVDGLNFALFCSPAINLFPKRCDRVNLSDRLSEYQVIPDRTRPRDYEVHSITQVSGHGIRSEQQQEFRPFYTARGIGGQELAYYSLNRVPRVLSSKEVRQGQRSKYAGSETYLSLVDANAAPISPDLRQLSVESFCTNRDLPMFLPIGRGQTDFTVDTGAPVISICCVSGVPTSPRASLAQGEFAWRLISHLSLNYLSISDDPRAAAGSETEQTTGAAIRDLLKLYGDLAEPQVRRQIDGVKAVSSKPIVHRVPAPGPISFARGLEVTVNFDEAAFEGTGAFLLGAVLDRFFARYVSINSFTKTVVRTIERGQIMSWPPRLGGRELL